MENKHTRKELKEYLLCNDFDLRNYKIRDIEDYPSGLELQDDKGRRIVVYNDYLLGEIRIVYVDIKKDNDFTNHAVRTFLWVNYNNRAEDLEREIRIEKEEIGESYIRYITKVLDKEIRVSRKFHVDTDVYDIYEYFDNARKELEAM